MKRSRNFTYYIALAVALVTFVLYLVSLRNGFVGWDDRVYIFENPHIRSFDLKFLKWAFFDFYESNWHPLTWISHAIDYAFWGLNPLGHHLTNIMLHVANTFLVVFLIIKLLDTLKQPATINTSLPGPLPERTILITAGVTGLLFGLHPLHVESVAWLAERKDLLCAFFFLLSIITYASYVKGLGDKTTQQRLFFHTSYLLAGLFFVLALLSKPMAVTLPVVLLILDWYPFNRIQSGKAFWPVLIEKLPFFALSLASSVLTILAQSAGGALKTLEFIPLSTRMLVAAKSLVAYLWNMIWPLHLMPFYPYPKVVTLLSFEYAAAITLVIGITIAGIVMAKTRKVWLIAWGSYVVMLIPVLGLVQVGHQAMADRYAYLPSLGPFLLGGLAAALLVEKVDIAKKRRGLLGVFSAVAAVFLIVLLSYLTIKQIAVWKDGIALWSHIIEKEPRRIPFAYQNRGTVFQRMGQFDRALQDYNTAITLAPSDPRAFFSRGLFFQETGDVDKAQKDYDAAIALDSNYSAAYDNRGVLLCRSGLFEKAIDDFNYSIAIDPRYAKAYNNRGIVYSLIGQYEKALEDFNKAILLERYYAKAYYGRGNLFLSTGKKELALADFQKACDLGQVEGCNALR